MLIDWFTVGAQALNFLILVWLLKRFLYKPILHAIDEREKKIAAELADANAKKAEAKKEQDEFKQKNEKFNQERTDLLSQVTNDAKAEREKLFADAKQSADDFAEKRTASLRKEEAKLQGSIVKRVQEGVLAISRKALSDLAGADLEERIVNVFMQQLKGSSIKASNMPVTVHTAFAIASPLQIDVEKQIKECFGADVQVDFQTNPNIICGIEITSNGQKVAWSLADYLASLEKGIDEQLKAKAKPEVKPEIKPEIKPDTKPGATS